MKSKIAWLFLIAFAVGACSRTAKPSAGLMLIVSSELQAPSQFDTLEVQISQAAGSSWKRIESHAYLVPKEARLPATIAIDPSPTGNQGVLIRAIALLGGAPVVLREVQTQVPTDRVAELRLVIGVRCVGDVTQVGAEGDVESKCPSGQSCQPATGSCGSNVADPGTLKPYVPGDEFLDAGTTPSLAPDASPEDSGIPDATVGGGPADGGLGDGGCPSGQLACSGACVANDAHNCGTCGHDCTALTNVMGATFCTADGQCSVPSASCAAGWGHCSSNPDDGCEVNITQPTHCGDCTTTCQAPTPLCSGSGATYTCASGCSASAPTPCTGGCVDTTTSAQNCKTCNNACSTSVAHATADCVASACGFTCNSGYDNCSGVCIDTKGTDTINCGICGKVCPVPPNGVAVCTAGSCSISCNAGYSNCSGACVNELTDPANCSKCASACPTTTPATGCINGVCGQVTQVAAGGSHTCWLNAGTGQSNGSVQCWGRDNYGQTGGVVNNVPSTGPGGLLPDATGSNIATGVTMIAAGDNHNCAIFSDDQVYCWGDNTYGQLGNGASLPGAASSTPVLVTGLTSYVITAIYAGGNRSCARDENHYVFCWGAAYLGNGTTGNSSTPVMVDNLVGPDTVGVGGASCVIDNSSIECFGANGYGQLGIGTMTDATRIIQQVANGGSVACGATHTCAVVGSGTVGCWGDDQSSALGSATVSETCSGQPCSTTEVLVPGITTATSVVANNLSTCVLTASGAVQCWGADSVGQVGNGQMVAAVATPATVGGITASSISSDANGAHVCALLKNGDVACWGSNQYGQLGNLTKNNSATPVIVQ